MAPSTASGHLHTLVDAGLLTVQRQGCHRYYRFAGPQDGRLIESVIELAPPQPIRSLRAHTRAHGLRQARTCYDHLAGRLGVSQMGALISRDALTGRGRHLRPGQGGGRLLQQRRPRRRLSGPLGRNLQQRLSALDWIRRSPSTRAVIVTDTGRIGLADTFSVTL
ncbi:MAG TPA: helix-turn-helix domain-containing protein [Pseudonocardia sp.]